MAKKPETVFKEWFMPKLSKIPRSWFFKVQMVMLCGIPDVLGCVNGRFVAMELKKSDKEAPDPLQLYVLHKLKGVGALVFVQVHRGNAMDVINEIERKCT